MIIAQQLSASQARLGQLAVTCIVLRLVYIALHIRGMASARSAVWALAFLVNEAILFIGR